MTIETYDDVNVDSCTGMVAIMCDLFRLEANNFVFF